MSQAEIRMTNLARGKPASQSSISTWSLKKTIEEDARIATSGNTSADAFFHTDRENAPWWQVDLQGDFAISEIRIYNRRNIAERLKYFSILVSLTGEEGSWFILFRKRSEVVFGQNDDIPFVIKPSDQVIARFVRVRLDESGFLHFRQCEVIGYEPDAAERARLTSRLQMLPPAEANEQAQRHLELMRGRRGQIARIGVHDVFVDLANYSPALIHVLKNGDYEGRERRIIKAAVFRGDRVLEIGTAIGVVSMMLASIVGAANVTTFDANPAIVADARRNFLANGLEGISANVGVLRNRSRWKPGEDSIEFFVSRDFWASRLHADKDSKDIAEVVRVPLVCLEDQLAATRATVLICDIEGGEADLLTGADLSSLRMIILEIHYWVGGRAPIDNMIKYLIQLGFSLNLDHTGDRVVVLDREI